MRCSHAHNLLPVLFKRGENGAESLTKLIDFGLARKNRSSAPSEASEAATCEMLRHACVFVKNILNRLRLQNYPRLRFVAL